VVEQITAYERAGVTTMAGLLFAANTVAETVDAMTEFSESVIRPMTRTNSHV
jgi:hypothetical protein